MTLTDHLRRRSTPVLLLALVTLVAALLASTVASEHSASADTDGHHATGPAMAAGHGPAAQPLSSEAAAFQDQMRKLWEDHVTWTRLAIVTFADGSEGFGATADRLMRNQEDLGDAIKPFYGDAAGNRLTALLKEHISIAVTLMQAAKDNDSAAVEQAAADWYVNGNQIADFLATANPRYWPQDAMRSGMRGHLDQTLDEATHELTGEYAAGVADYERIHAHILAMADTLSAGIIATFPGAFR